MALDVGTSSARALCFDETGRPRAGAEGRATYEPTTTPDGGVELDAEVLLAAVADAVDGCLAGAGAEPVAAVGVSAFWHGLLALDGDGRPLTAVMTWADTRSAGAARELRRRLDAAAIHARTGVPLHAAYFPAKLRWVRESRPDVFRQTRLWCGFPEYLAARLTGAARASVSMASGTGLLDHGRLQWDPELLGICGLDARRLPPIDDAAAPGLVASYADRWPTLAGARWFPGWGDGACSSVGSDCVGLDRIALNVGTSAAMRLVTRSVPRTPPGLWRYRVDALRSVVGGATSEGGNVVAWCRESLVLPAGDDELERAVAAVAPDGHGLTVLPFLAGERSPGWRDDARGHIGGLALGSTPAQVLRALMESVAYRLAMIYERLGPLAARGHRVVASGGALNHFPVWAGILADVLGVPLTMFPQAEASSRGAALLALAGLGVSVPVAPLTGEAVPADRERHEVYRSAMERHRRLYETVVGPPLS